MALRIFLVFVLLIGSTIGVLYYFSRDEVVDYVTEYSNRSVRLSGDTLDSTHKKPVPLWFLADTIYKFLITTFEKDNEIFLSKKCNFKNCTLSNPAHLPGRSWYLLSHSRATSLDTSPGQLKEKDRKVAAERFKKVFSEWLLHADRNSEVYSTHQLYSAYHLHKGSVAKSPNYRKRPILR